MFDQVEPAEALGATRIAGFVAGQTQLRITFTRRGEQMTVVCITEQLACAQLAAIDSLRDWELVSAVLEPLGSRAG